MMRTAYCLFETPLGSCGIAWREGENPSAPPAVAFFQLPEATAETTEARIARKTRGHKSSAPPPQILEVIERVRKHLRGQMQDFGDVTIVLDEAGQFARQVYEAARRIPAGQTMTYGELAKAMGQPGTARAVGQALGRNPIPVIIPCHRILAAGGKPGGFSAPGGRATKARMLATEGVSIAGGDKSLFPPLALLVFSF